MRRYRHLIFVLLFLIVLLVISELTGLRQHFSFALLRQILSENIFTGLLIFVLLFTVGNLIHIPGLVFLAAAVLTLGRVNGGLATYIAASTSCACTFFVINYLGGAALREIDNKTASKLLDHLDAHPVRNIFILRILFQTLPAINYALAMSGVGFRKYMLGTLLGLPLPIAMYCLFVAQLTKYIHLD